MAKKLKTIINELEKARQRYIKYHGKEPVLSCIDDNGGDLVLTLCKGHTNIGFGIRVEKPYQELSIKGAY